MSFPVKDTRTQNLVEFEVAITANASLESAGRRGVLFNRLIDEYGPAQGMVAANAQPTA